MDARIKQRGHGFATYPAIPLRGYTMNKKTNKLKFGFLKQLIFGDYIRIYKENAKPVTVEEGGETYVKVRARAKDGYILPEHIQFDRPMEINFVDVAQGDGCHVVTPDDKHFIIDAGQGSNMYRFLSWRFNLRNSDNKPPKMTAIITHSDQDHYAGFAALFSEERNGKKLFSFNTVYHNGLVEESGPEPSTLGKIIKDAKDNEYVTDLVDTPQDFIRRSDNAHKVGNYIKLLRKTDARIKSLRQGSDPIYDQGNLKFEVIGPVAQKVNNQDTLPVLADSKGKTKNGHSVILKITQGKMRFLLGGDLNSVAEEYLFKCHTNTDIDKQRGIIVSGESSAEDKVKAQEKIDKAIVRMRKTFEADISKSCHHGSADFTTEFLQAINPIATIISSGDDESHCHPRPDTLGTVGKHSRGKRSLIFSTELARSTKEFLNLTTLSAKKKKQRLVTVYGMINVRSDGEKAIIAQKLERPGASRNWDIHCIEWNTEMKEFEYMD